MAGYKMFELSRLLRENSYPGRGIVVGTTECGRAAVVAYFIMGRSENSRNRVFTETEDGIRTEAFDAAKMSDPSLIIYHPVRETGKRLIVTNGDQTDTIRDYVNRGETFEAALSTRCFEPDAPNFTPRISAILDFEGGYGYKMSILKSADEKGSACCRYTYSYPSLAGVGHFIHTYSRDGSPIPSFEGEPEAVSLSGGPDDFTDMVWESLNEANKVSLYTCYYDIASGKKEIRIVNKNK